MKTKTIRLNHPCERLVGRRLLRASLALPSSHSPRRRAAGQAASANLLAFLVIYPAVLAGVWSKSAWTGDATMGISTSDTFGRIISAPPPPRRSMAS